MAEDTRAPRDLGRPRGPRASLKQLVPYLLSQRGPLALALTPGVIGAGTPLVQPVLLGQVIERVQASQPLGLLLVARRALVPVHARPGGCQH